MSNSPTYTNTGALMFGEIVEVRDIINRVEALETECDGIGEADCPELVALVNILDELEGMGMDEKWRGDWYPSSLIHDAYFTAYTKELLEDCGTIPKDLPEWVYIDWDKTAHNVKQDYTPFEIAGQTYWTR